MLPLSLLLSLSALRVYSAIRPSFFRCVVLAVPTFPFPPARTVRFVAVARLLETGTGDVFDARRKVSRGLEERKGEMGNDCRERNFFPLFNSASLGSWTPKFFYRAAVICACVYVAAKWLQRRMFIACPLHRDIK